MGKFLQKYGILFFFCAMMGGIIMVDSIFAIAFTDKERGLATEFSDYTMKISILQADSQEAFRQKEFLLFLQEKAQIETINVLKANSQNGELLYSNEFESMQSNALEQAPDTAVTGVYYLDGGKNTNLIFQELQNQILTKNQYAQIVVLEDSSKGYLLERLKNSQDATYYLLQMGLLVLLNLLNFGNVASCWANYRRTEIAVRKMVGGTDGTIFRKIMILFGAATGLFILIGMMIGILIAKKYMEITSIALLFGIINCLIQWLILILFGGLSIHRYVRKNIMELRKQS